VAISRVNSAFNTDQSGTTHTAFTTTGTFSSTTGNLLVTVVKQGTNNTPPSSVKNAAGTSFTHIVGADASWFPSNLLSIWYLPNITGNVSDTVTANWAVGNARVAVLAAEYSGITAVSPLDTAVGGDQTNAQYGITSPTFSTVYTLELFIMGIAGSAANGAFNASTVLFGANVGDAFLVDAIPGSQSCVMTDNSNLGVYSSGLQTNITASMQWLVPYADSAISVATFKAALAGSPSSVIVTKARAESFSSSGTIVRTRIVDSIPSPTGAQTSGVGQIFPTGRS